MTETATMSERINLSELRNAGPAWVTETQLAALVEAVEAARDLVDNVELTDQDDPLTMWVVAALHALRRFDFGSS